MFVHSNNLVIKFESALQIVELVLRISRCPSWCERCLNPELCELCAAPNYVLNYRCVSNCSTYYHLRENRTCLSRCPSGFYPLNTTSTNKVCETCVSPCISCLGPDKCLSCVTGTFLFAYSCLPTCPSLYYASVSNLTCVSCVSPCRTCLNASKCLSCVSGFWDNSTCSNTCPPGFYGDISSSECKPCHSSCSLCSSGPTRCSQCVLGYYLHNSQCLLACPDRYYATATMTCTLCKSPCLTCTS